MTLLFFNATFAMNTRNYVASTYGCKITN